MNTGLVIYEKGSTDYVPLDSQIFIPWYDISEFEQEVPCEFLELPKIEQRDSSFLINYINKIAYDYTHLFILCWLSEHEYTLINHFKSLKALYIFIAPDLKDISFISHLDYLKDLYINFSIINDLTPIKNLILRQQEIYFSFMSVRYQERLWIDIYESMLSNIGIMNAKITSLDTFEDLEASVSELNISYNDIDNLESIKNIHMTYLNISHTNISLDEASSFIKAKNQFGIKNILVSDKELFYDIQTLP
ncbi:hypothetical protein ACWG0P_13290 [Amedibacillus sp. YH-ame6]